MGDNGVDANGAVRRVLKTVKRKKRLVWRLKLTKDRLRGKLIKWGEFFRENSRKIHDVSGTQRACQSPFLRQGRRTTVRIDWQWNVGCYAAALELELSLFD